jgi:radical SAM protein with 4Fe4S-binding SPASM domain
MENVIRLSKKCRERKKQGLEVPSLQVSTIEIPEYMERQQEFIDFWKQYVDVVRVYYEHDDKGKFRNDEVRKQLEKEIPERRPCRKIFTDFLIYWNGELALCNYDWNGGLKGMNVKDKSIYEIWHSDIYENVRKMHNENTFSDTIMCKDCQHWRIDYTSTGFLGKTYKGNS